jgi:outer membrane protein OmpA-like peptidoglycan-associated protein
VDLDVAEFQAVKEALEKTNILFVADSAKTLPDQVEIMEQAAKHVQRLLELSHQLRTLTRIKILGHTDRMGSQESNMKLSRLRADRIFDFLVSQGIPSGQLSVQPMGSTQSLTGEPHDEKPENNRRVSFSVALPQTLPSQESWFIPRPGIIHRSAFFPRQ